MQQNNPLVQCDVRQKLLLVEASCHNLLMGQNLDVPQTPGREVEVRNPSGLPAKIGLSQKEGQARLLHDLASIELQAMELGVRTLSEFPVAPKEMREQLVDVILEEASHLQLCLDAMESLGYFWGDWPVHIGLWNAVSAEDSLLDRVLIVHRFLEGSGLDASEHLQRRLLQIGAPETKQTVNTIAEDELGHVLLGGQWYRHLCRLQGLDPEVEFKQRMWDLLPRLPRRREAIEVERRKRAGFSDSEIQVLQEIRSHWVKGREG